MPMDMNTPDDSGMQELLDSETLAWDTLAYYEPLFEDKEREFDTTLREKGSLDLLDFEDFSIVYGMRQWYLGFIEAQRDVIADLVDDGDETSKEIERLRFERDELQYRLCGVEADKYEYERRLYEAQASRSNRGGYDYD